MMNMSRTQQVLNAANALIELCAKYSMNGVIIVWQEGNDWVSATLSPEILRSLNKSSLINSLFSLMGFDEEFDISAKELIRLHLEGKLEEVVLTCVLSNMAGNV